MPIYVIGSILNRAPDSQISLFLPQKAQVLLFSVQVFGREAIDRGLFHLSAFAPAPLLSYKVQCLISVS